ncbi:hypothetical protein LguiA_014371 [Lonicera macranthoides]
MKHFSHRHPLVLKERQNNYDDNENDNIDLQRIHRCNGCAEPMISGPFYSCDRYNCEFFLHKSCAELPRKIEHPLHPDHSLTLFERPLRSMTCCNGCKKSVHNFIYSCSLCNFVLDILCASITESTITHPSHQHPLTPLRRPVLSMCDACGTEHKGFFYVCSTCNQFWLHRDCASLPKILENTDHHDHPLTLTYCIPPQFSMFVYGCGICPKQVVTYNWAYYCHNCRYFAHLNCATSKSEAFMSILLPAHKDHLLCLKANCSYKCDACPFIKDSSVFAFCCETCDFQIHTNCAILPSTIRHRYDETHPFTLRNCPVEDHSDDYYCDICEKELNPLWSFYHCIDCDKSMHAKCVPAFDWRSHIKFGGVLTVKGHEHPLDSVPVTRGYVQCNDYSSYYRRQLVRLLW